MSSIDTVAFTVSDMNRSVEFYTRVLQFSKLAERDIHGEPYEKLLGQFGVHARAAVLTLESEALILVEYRTSKGHPRPIDSQSHDHWTQQVTIAVSDMDKAYQWIHDRGAPFVSPLPQRFGELKAFQLRDPDGYALQLVQYPRGKGDARWQRDNRAGKLFLGIDRTSIVVASLDRSLLFYRDQLGLIAAPGEDRSGPDESRLQGLAGVSLKTVELKAVKGWTLELRQFVTPSDGRSIPVTRRPSDYYHAQTFIRTVSLAPFSALTPEVVQFPEKELKISKASLVRDPDGHAIVLLEK